MNKQTVKIVFTGSVAIILLFIGYTVYGAPQADSWNIGDGWMWFTQAGDGNVHSNVSTPVDPLNVANKNYVDSELASATTTGIWETGGDNIYNANSGNVGIGTTSPGSKLSVSGGAVFGASYEGEAMSDGNVAISGNVGIGTVSPSNKLDVSGDASISGNLGIGATVPSYTLDVDGNANFSGPVFIGTPTAGSHAATMSYVDEQDASHFCPDYVEDVEGNSYSTVSLGNGQCWMAENMRTTTYPDGTAITKGPVAQGSTEWENDNGYYSCPPNSTNDGEDCVAAETLGMLYQWSATMNGSTAQGAQGICPDGWHVPTDSEQYALENYLQESGSCSATRNGSWDCDPAGSKMAGNVSDQSWTSNSLTSHEDFGATGLDFPPSGYRVGLGTVVGDYHNRSYNTGLWSSTEASSGLAWSRRLGYGYTTVYRYDNVVSHGFSVRCAKD
jgi:uncharacterized protein (TIGR02145 family)